MVTKPTRAEIAMITGGNHRMTRAFELLFEGLNETTDTVEAQGTAAASQSDALQALSDGVGVQSTTISTLSTALAAQNTRVTEIENATSAVFQVAGVHDGPLVGPMDDWTLGFAFPVGCTLSAVTLFSEAAGTSVDIEVLQNGILTYTSTHTVQSSVTNPSSELVFAAGDFVSFRTGAISGTWSDCRVCAWFEVV